MGRSSGGKPERRAKAEPASSASLPPLAVPAASVGGPGEFPRLPALPDPAGHRLRHAANPRYRHFHAHLPQSPLRAFKRIHPHCHSARGSSALKSIADEHVIVGNLFESASSDEPDKDRYSSTFLVDVPAASDNLIAWNTFRYRGQSLSRSAVGIRRRASILGCDRPSYFSQAFHSPAFWRAVAACGLDCDPPDPAAARNPFFIHTFIFRNTFEYVGDKPQRAPAGVTWGTLPETTLVSFGPKLPLRRPEGWLERSRVWLANNRYLGVHERWRDLAASTESFATREQYERSRERVPSAKMAEAIEPYLAWNQPAPQLAAPPARPPAKPRNPPRKPGSWRPPRDLAGRRNRPSLLARCRGGRRCCGREDTLAATVWTRQFRAYHAASVDNTQPQERRPGELPSPTQLHPQRPKLTVVKPLE